MSSYRDRSLPTANWLYAYGHKPRQKTHRAGRNSIRVAMELNAGRRHVTIEVDIEEDTSRKALTLHGRFLHFTLVLQIDPMQTPMYQKQIDAYMSYDNVEVAPDTKQYVQLIQDFTSGRHRLALKYSRGEWRIDDMEALRDALETWE